MTPRTLLPFALCKHTRRRTGTSDRMPAPSKRPSPPARMVELLADWKVIVTTIDKRPMTTTDFRVAWARSWEIMIDERAWAHATRFRRGSRISMLAARHEARCSFLDEPSAFAYATGRLSVAAGNMCLQLEPTQVPAALLAAIGYTQTMADHAEAA